MGKKDKKVEMLHQLHWDIDSLNEKLQDLEQRLEDTFDNTEKFKICHDINTLKSLINYYLGYKYYDAAHKNPYYEDLIEDKKNNSLELLKENKEVLLENFRQVNREYEKFIFVPFSKKSYNPDCESLLLDFFNNSLIEKYLNEHRINISKKLLNKKGSKSMDNIGDVVTCGLYADRAVYIYTLDQMNILTSTNVVYGLGHAEVFEKVSEPRDYQMMTHGMYKDSYAILMELKYAKYLEQNGFKNESLKIKSNVIKSFFNHAIKESGILNNKENLNDYDLQSLLSFAQALYFANLEEEGLLTKEEITIFKNMLVNCYDSDIYNIYPDVWKGAFSYFDKYQENVRSKTNR